MLTSLIGVGGVTQAEVDGVKAMALQPASRAEVLFGAEVQITEADVRAAEGRVTARIVSGVSSYSSQSATSIPFGVNTHAGNICPALIVPMSAVTRPCRNFLASGP
jgi:hypothetical protein